uniref:Uncharacterized protein n=1 Tax=Anguilla anguilla TaxID=7936 RepID=A0A0E9SHH9_ANGAN
MIRNMTQVKCLSVASAGKPHQTALEIILVNSGNQRMYGDERSNHKALRGIWVRYVCRCCQCR